MCVFQPRRVISAAHCSGSLTISLHPPSPAPLSPLLSLTRATLPRPTLQIPLECAASFVLCLAGCLLLSSGFKPINCAEEHPLNSFHRLFGPRLDTRRALGPSEKAGAGS